MLYEVSVRNMSSSSAEVAAWRPEIAAGVALAPLLAACFDVRGLVARDAEADEESV